MCYYAFCPGPNHKKTNQHRNSYMHIRVPKITNLHIHEHEHKHKAHVHTRTQPINLWMFQRENAYIYTREYMSTWTAVRTCAHIYMRQRRLKIAESSVLQVMHWWRALWFLAFLTFWPLNLNFNPLERVFQIFKVRYDKNQQPSQKRFIVDSELRCSSYNKPFYFTRHYRALFATL